jgi:hypothetical protein
MPLKGKHPYSCFEGDPMDKQAVSSSWYAEKGCENVLFTDDKIFTIKEQYNNQNKEDLC